MGAGASGGGKRGVYIGGTHQMSGQGWHGLEEPWGREERKGND